MDLEYRIDQAYFIYLGKVVKSEFRDDGVIESSLKVVDTYKGTASNTVLESETFETSLCGVRVAVGDKIVVFGGYEGEVGMSTCSHTQPLHSIGRGGLRQLESLKKVDLKTSSRLKTRYTADRSVSD